MRKSSRDYIRQLKNELENTYNFIDYFLVIGLSPDIISSDYLYENEIKDLNQSKKIIPEIISKFPPFEKSNVPLDDNIIKVN